MDFLPNTDNFFKYLLTAGLILIAFTIMFPVQKQKEVDIEILAHKEADSLLTYEITKLEELVVSLKSKAVEIQVEIDSLKVIQKKSIPSIAKAIESDRINRKKIFDSIKARGIEFGDSLKIRAIRLKIHEEKIEKLESYYKLFKSFKLVFIVFGLVLIIVGLRYWASSVYQDELIKEKNAELEKSSAYVRHINRYCGKRMRALFMLSLIVLILILLIFYYSNS